LLGDMIFRPHMAFGSDAFIGSGIASLYTSGFTSQEKWVAGDVLIEPLYPLKR